MTAHWVAVLLVVAISLAAFDNPGTSDVITWSRWTANAESLGVRAGYAANSADYPPFCTFMLVLTASAGDLVGVDRFTAFKASLLVFLVLTALAFWIATRDLLLSVLLYAALTLDAVGLAYLDVYFAPLLLLAMHALRTGRLMLFSIGYTVACLTKWQPIILLPFFVVHLTSMGHLRDLGRLVEARVLRSVVLPALSVVAVCFACYGVEPAYSFARALRNDFLSGNALNSNWILTHALHVGAPEQFGPLQDGLATCVKARDAAVMLPPRLVFCGAYALALLSFMRGQKTFANLLRFALVAYLCHVTFNVGVHENHLFAGVLLAFLLWHIDRTFAAKAVGIALFANLNLVVFYGVSGIAPAFDRTVVGVDLALSLAALWTLFFAMLYLPVIRGLGATAAPRSAPP